jgi:hypothetical protein
MVVVERPVRTSSSQCATGLLGLLSVLKVLILISGHAHGQGIAILEIVIIGGRDSQWRGARHPRHDARLGRRPTRDGAFRAAQQPHEIVVAEIVCLDADTAVGICEGDPEILDGIHLIPGDAIGIRAGVRHVVGITVDRRVLQFQCPGERREIACLLQPRGIRHHHRIIEAQADSAQQGDQSQGKEDYDAAPARIPPLCSFEPASHR